MLQKLLGMLLSSGFAPLGRLFGTLCGAELGKGNGYVHGISVCSYSKSRDRVEGLCAREVCGPKPKVLSFDVKKQKQCSYILSCAEVSNPTI